MTQHQQGCMANATFFQSAANQKNINVRISTIRHDRVTLGNPMSSLANWAGLAYSILTSSGQPSKPRRFEITREMRVSRSKFLIVNGPSGVRWASAVLE